MSLYLSRDDGSGTFFPDAGFVDLVQIANMDLGIGQTDDPADTKGVLVTYERTDPGIPPLRLDDLCNEVSYSGVDIIIFPVDGSFALSDGTPITSVAGVAIPVGHALNPTAADIVTFYDTSECNGSGWWVDQEGGGTTDFPRPVILYHELSHCIHFATGTADPDGAQEEVAAETDENDMRDQLGISHREVTSHNGGCGGGPTSCCVVASVASGSPFSTVVNQLRRYRDHFLRRTRVGHDFFLRLHHDYYAVSPQVVRLMSRSTNVHGVVRDRFVTPLVLGLDLIARHLQEPDADLGRAVAADRSADDLLEEAAAEFPPDLVAAMARTAGSPVVTWGLLDVVTMWTTAADAARRGEPADRIGQDLGRAIDDWSGRLPIGPIWAGLAPGEVDEELSGLGDLLLRSPHSRTTFARRLIAAHPRLRDQVARWEELS